MDKKQLRILIRNTLNAVNLYSQSAEELLLLTAAQESQGGKYIRQIKGPALGIMQMEPKTFYDHVNHFLRYKEELRINILSTCNMTWYDESSLIYNLRFSIIMARIHYLRFSEMLPLHTDIHALATYYKKYYNTKLGKATVKEAIKNYKKYVL